MTEVRPYLLQNLLSLVHVHAEVKGIAPALVHRVMEALLVELAAVLLNCLKRIPRLDMGGMLRVS